jgi:lysophospholipase L1-like esterase
MKRICRHTAALLVATAVGGIGVADVGAETRPMVASVEDVPLAPASPLAADPKAACAVSASQARFAYPLARMARRLANEKPIKIVAIGSSSTAGAGASSPEATYPSRLERELGEHFSGYDITVLNRGVNGEEAPDMLARFDASVVAEEPDLVLWQVGTNWVLRDRPLDPKATVLHEGLARLKSISSDVVMIDPQYAPKVIAKPEAEAMVAQIAAAAKEENVDLFPRFALMKRWFENDHLPFDQFVSADGLHMNDWSYGCLAKWLGTSIEEAASRLITTAVAPRQMR